MEPSELSEMLLGVLRDQFYRNDAKGFYQERNLLLQAATFPAKWLDERKVRLSAARYREILAGIIRGIKRCGTKGEIRRFSVYLLHCIQEHMRHHGEDYYDEGKRTRQAIEEVMHGLRKSAPQIDSTVPVLAEVHRVLARSKTGRRRATRTASTQLDLLGPCKPASRRLQKPENP